MSELHPSEFDKAAKNPVDLSFYLLAGPKVAPAAVRPGPKPRGGLA